MGRTSLFPLRAIGVALAGLGLLAAPARAAPPVAGRHPVTIADLMSLTDLSGLSVSPDGRFAATLAIQPSVSANTYRIGWMLLPLDGRGSARRAGDGGEVGFFDSRFRLDGRFGADFRDPARWAPDGRSFAYLRQSGGQVEVWRTRLADLQQEQLTRSGADVEDFVWTADGRDILFSTAASRAQIRDLEASQHRNGFLLTPTTPWSYQFQQPFVDRYGPVGGRPLVWVLDLATGLERRATQDQAAEFARLIEARDTPVAAASSGPAPVAMPLLDPKKDRAWIPLAVRTRPGFQSECATFGCGGEFVAATDGGRAARSWWVGRNLFLLRRDGWNEPGMTLWRWPVGHAQARPVAHLDDNLTDCTRLGVRLVCLLQTPTAPRRVVWFDLSDGRVSTAYDPNPQWRAVELGETAWVRFADDAGRRTYGVLIKPLGFQAGRRYPMVVIGYGTVDAVRGDIGERYPAQVLAAHGFVVLVYHLWASEALHPYRDYLVRMYSGGATDGKVSYDQIHALVDGLVRQGLVDPDRVGIGGHSEALNTIAWGLTHGDLFKTVATDWVRWNDARYFMPVDTYQGMLQWSDLLRDPNQPPGKITRDFSLALHVHEVRAPILVNASGLELDSTFQWEALRRFADAGRPLEMHVAPDEEHVVFEPYHRWLEYRRNLQWFEYWLQDRRAADPVDGQQYARWDRMRVQLKHVRGEEPEGE